MPNPPQSAHKYLHGQTAAAGNRFFQDLKFYKCVTNLIRTTVKPTPYRTLKYLDKGRLKI
ncbi:hypothetical protein l11_03280 [Neisseria weaveri LMG 5135]|nr:hypothetical protein l13_08700 [Neisseria weaveri ATCC 51223]EGV38881.1 hypothetical protein l11_03280 [Neisseria weaveri LMG 5135]